MLELTAKLFERIDLSQRLLSHVGSVPSCAVPVESPIQCRLCV